jgi:hypothetical protein
MAVVYGSPDLLPMLSVVYACECGACECGACIGEYGGDAGDPPRGWVRMPEDTLLCEHCAAVARDTGQI